MASDCPVSNCPGLPGRSVYKQCKESKSKHAKSSLKKITYLVSSSSVLAQVMPGLLAFSFFFIENGLWEKDVLFKVEELSSSCYAILRELGLEIVSI